MSCSKNKHPADQPTVGRRSFLAASGVAAAVIATPSNLHSAAADEVVYASAFHDTPDRVWPGPLYWTNPLQDWRIADGRLECINAAPGRNIHLLSHDIASGAGEFVAEVTLGSLDTEQLSDSKSSAGFLLGVKGELSDYRHHLIYGRGIFAGLRAGHELVIGNGPQAPKIKLDLSTSSVKLILRASLTEGSMKPVVSLEAIDPTTDTLLATVTHKQLAAADIVGNAVLTANFAPPAPAGKKNAGTASGPPSGGGLITGN